MRNAFHRPCPPQSPPVLHDTSGCDCCKGPRAGPSRSEVPLWFAARSTTSKAIRTRGSVIPHTLVAPAISRPSGWRLSLRGGRARAVPRRSRAPQSGPASDVASVVVTRGPQSRCKHRGPTSFGVPKPSDGIQHARCLALAAERSPDWLLRDPALARLRTSRQGQERRCADGRRWRSCQHANRARDSGSGAMPPCGERRDFSGGPSGRHLVSRADGWSAVAAGAVRINRSVWRFHRCHTPDPPVA